MNYNRSIIITLLALLTLCASTLARAEPAPVLTDPYTQPPANDPIYNPNPKPTPTNPPPDGLPTTAPNDPTTSPKPSRWGIVRDNIKKILKPNPYEIGIGIAIRGLGELVDYVMNPDNNAPRLPEPMCYYTVVNGGAEHGYYNSYEEVFEKMTPNGSKFIEKRDQYHGSPSLMGNRYYGWYKDSNGSYFHHGDVYRDCSITKPQEVPQPETQPKPLPVPSPAPDTQPNPSPSPSPAPDTQPKPLPVPSPAPDTQPNPSPSPSPAPDTQPSPSPSPSPAPETQPKPLPVPSPSPNDKPQDESKPFELPAFCDWAKHVCDFIDWVKTDPPTPEAPTHPKIKEIDKDYDINPNLYNASGQCPPPIQVNIGMGSIDIPYDSLCLFFTKNSPLIVAIAYLIGAFIIIGKR